MRLIRTTRKVTWADAYPFPASLPCCVGRACPPAAELAPPVADLGPGQGAGGHRRFTLATDIQVYFCDPQSPWQRGSNENTNGLLRQYFPKGIDVSGFSQAQLDEIARRLNERPRKTLDFETPIERYRQAVALTN